MGCLTYLAENVKRIYLIVWYLPSSSRTSRDMGNLFSQNPGSQYDSLSEGAELHRKLSKVLEIAD